MEIQGVELEVWLGLVAAVLALGVWALKRYQKINADGVITLDEPIGTIDESEELIDKVVDEAEKVEAALDAASATDASATEDGSDSE